MLRDGIPNPLNVHGLREIEHCPPHFIHVDFDLVCPKKQISDWIWENLEGRFWLGDRFILVDNGNVGMITSAAFEIPGEASMFGLCLSTINTLAYY